MSIKEMLDEIRRIIGETDRSIPEKEVYEALVDEASLWEARLYELTEEEEGEE